MRAEEVMIAGSGGGEGEVRARGSTRRMDDSKASEEVCSRDEQGPTPSRMRNRLAIPVGRYRRQGREEGGEEDMERRESV